MFGGSKGSGWDRTQNRAWSQYNDRQKQQRPWEQGGSDGWAQSGGGRSTQAANAWDANAYKRAATGGGGGGGWGGGGTTYRGPSQQQAWQSNMDSQARQQQDQGYYDWKAKQGTGTMNASGFYVGPQDSRGDYQKHLAGEQAWEREQGKMEQEMSRREHQRGLQESPEQMMQMFNVMNQMKEHFPEGWMDDFWKRMIGPYMTQSARGYTKPVSTRDYWAWEY